MAANHKYELNATVRHDLGKGASRRLRRAEKVPGVIYGGGKEAVSLTFEHNKAMHALEHEGFYSHILTLIIDGQPEKVILKDVQRHLYKPRIQHMDFQRIRSDVKLHMHIPLHFTNADKAPGVKEGGLVSHIMSDVEVSCLPADLPEYLEIDLGNMNLNDILHLSNIPLPKGVTIVDLAHENDKPVVSVHLPRIEEEPVEEPTEAPIAPSEVPAMSQKSDEEIAAENAAKAAAKAKEKK